MHKATDKKIAFGDNSIRFFPIQSFQKKNRDPDFFVGTVVSTSTSLSANGERSRTIRKVFYTFLHHKKIIRKTIILAITFVFLVSPSTPLWAEDYPAWVGFGYRKNSNKIIEVGYDPEVYKKIERLQEERVDKRNQAEEIAAYASQATPESANGILATEYQHQYNADNLKREIILQRQQRENFASTNLETGFRYLPHSDGKIEYFKDGLLIKTENERVVDEFGNVSYRNSDNYQYDDNRLLTSFKAAIKDRLGNITHIRQYGIKYTADSLFYGGKDANANKNIIEYFLEETDSAGNVKLSYWQALSYVGKLVKAFHQRIEDSIYGIIDFIKSNIIYTGNDPDKPNSYHEEGIGTDGLAYSLDRSGITYNDKGQTTGYHEEKITTHLDGGKIKTITDAKFKYLNVPHQFGPDVEEPDPDRILESVITTTTENPDGSRRTETNTTTNNYDGLKLIGTSGHSEFNGQEASWWQYTDAQGHILSRSEDEDGNITYSYVDPQTKETITVAEDQVTATLKDGNKFSGTSEVQYEIPYGEPMTKQVDSVVSYYHPESLDLLRTEESTLTHNNGLVNNLPRVFDTQEHSTTTYPLTGPEGAQRGIKDITTTYIYAENGNLEDAIGTGTGSGYELTGDGWMKYTSEINIDYEVILGEAKQKHSEEKKDYK